MSYRALSFDVCFSVFLFQIDSTAVKEMDRTLCLEDEISVVYDELMKTMTKDHLNLDIVSIVS